MVILFSFLSCNDKSKISNLPESKIEDFNILIKTGYEDSYDSKNNTFKREFIDSIHNVWLKLTPENKIEIYNMYKKLDINSMPEKFEIYETGVISMHSSNSSIEFCTSPNNCHRIELDFDDIKIKDVKEIDKAIKFKYFFDYVWNIIKSNERYYQIPESDKIYF